MTFVLVQLLFAFTALWFGAGLAVKTIAKISHTLHTSSFFISFFVLGLFTSITEIMVGITSTIEGKPEIYVGNLLGSSVVVFLGIIPLLAIIGNGIKLNHSFRFKDLVSASIVVGFPAILTIDNKITFIDAVLNVVIYLYFVFMLERKSGLVDKLLHIDTTQKTVVFSYFKIIGAIILVFTGSHILVQQTPVLGEMIGISPYVISILLISIGTNIPEISIAVRSILAKNKDIAFGNYVGSASLNTLEMGILSLFSRSPIPANGSNYSVVVFIAGLVFFVLFVKSKNTMSRIEGVYLFLCYFLFVIFELTTGSGWNISGH